MSDLNCDIFNRYLADIQSYACGHPFETADHFLLFCPDYRHIHIDTIIQKQDNYSDIQTLLFGNQSLGTHRNEFMFTEFIGRTRRF